MFLVLVRSISKMCLTLFQKVKKRFQSIKKQKVKKVEKIRIFPKGLVHGFGKKNWKFFLVSIFSKINQQNVFNVILESHKAFLDYTKHKVEKVEKSGFFQRDQSMVLVKKFEIFPCFYFLQKTASQMCLTIFQILKKLFLNLVQG